MAALITWAENAESCADCADFSCVFPYVGWRFADLSVVSTNGPLWPTAPAGCAACTNCAAADGPWRCEPDLFITNGWSDNFLVPNMDCKSYGCGSFTEQVFAGCSYECNVTGSVWTVRMNWSFGSGAGFRSTVNATHWKKTYVDTNPPSNINFTAADISSTVGDVGYCLAHGNAQLALIQ